ncbi:hypothetical protein MMC12_006468 [Toensbergia leucococca]|nr:hypothetical protein [Toensbergia leucococca]
MPTSFLPQLHPNPQIAHLAQTTTLIPDILSLSPDHTPTGPPLSSAPDAAITTLIDATHSFVKTHMSTPQFDASHDYAHIKRVLSLSHHILKAEQATHPSILYNPTIITLTALLHDIADHKYITTAPTTDPNALAKQTLLLLGADPETARAVQAIINSLPYSHEILNPARVRGVLLHHPELGIVQDADRLDALGAVGIGRAFTFGAAKGKGRGRALEGTLEHFEEKLFRLEGMMKTGEGRRLARERVERLRIFRSWWEEEWEMGMCG